MIQKSIDIRNARCTSIINDEPKVNELDRFIFLFRGNTKIKGVRCKNVMFFPDCGLQVINNQIVPREAVFDDYALTIMQERHGGTNSGTAIICESEIIKGDFCILSNCFSRNFAHWTEELFKVIVLEDYGFTGSYLVPDDPLYCREFMRLIGVPDERILGDRKKPTLFENVIYTTQVGHLDVLNYPEIVNAFREILFSACPDAFSLGDRLWLERKQLVRNTNRALVNEDEVYEVLQKHNVQVVDFAEYSLCEQIAAARSMKVLSGPHGAAFVHSLFMDPNSTVLECFSPMHLNPSCIELYQLLHHRYIQVVPTNTVYEPYPHGNRLELNINHLKLELENLDAF